MALAIDREGTRRREQAFQLVNYGDGITGLQFLMPCAVENTVFEERWYFHPRSRYASHRQLSLFMAEKCDMVNSFPDRAETYLNFEIRYDADYKPIDETFGHTTTWVACVDYTQCDEILNGKGPVLDALTWETRQQNEFAKGVLRRAHVDHKKILTGEKLARCLSIEANLGISRYMVRSHLTGLKMDMPKNAPRDEDGRMRFWPLTYVTKGNICRGTAYARNVDQHINLMQCLSFHKTGKNFMSKEQCKAFAKQLNEHDGRLHLFDIAVTDMTAQKEKSPASCDARGVSKPSLI